MYLTPKLYISTTIQGQIMQVTITENATEKIIATYPIVLGGLNYTPTEAQYKDQAWENAIEDKLVSADGRNEYTITLGQ
jgi:hypothetical protein